jgi:hypothetical protein
VEQILAPDNLLSSPTLVSFVTPANTLPVSALLTDSALLRFRATANEVSIACANLKYDVVRGHVRLPFRVFKNSLILKTAAGREDLARYLAALNGSDAFDLRSIGDDWLVRSDQLLIFAMWRAFKYVPLNGELVDAKMSSSLSQPKEEVEPFVYVKQDTSPQPIARQRVQKGRAQRNQRRNDHWNWAPDNEATTKSARLHQQSLRLDQKNFPPLSSV